MFEGQCIFLKTISEISEEKVEKSIKKLNCDVIALDGTLSVSDNLDIVLKKIKDIL